MKKNLSRCVVDIWYDDQSIGKLLMPLGIIFSYFVWFRKFLYRFGVLKKHTMPVPVIVIGNITVGGTGKTPLIIWLAQMLKNEGFKPGIISRGYGGKAESWPQWVHAGSTAEIVGDEALLIAKQTCCPMAVGPSRVDAARLLLDGAACDVVLSDDGLQHYALDRDIEIAVVDGDRRFGNGYCLPAGPLREPIARLQDVDFIVVNGEKSLENEFSMQITGNTAVSLVTKQKKPLHEFKTTGCHALAGIGNPGRFFKLLESAGLDCETHSYPDHYKFQRCDISFPGLGSVFMTEKDAVKCMAFAGGQHWYVPVQAVPETNFAGQLLDMLRKVIRQS